MWVTSLVASVCSPFGVQVSTVVQCGKGTIRRSREMYAGVKRHEKKASLTPWFDSIKWKCKPKFVNHESTATQPANRDTNRARLSPLSTCLIQRNRSELGMVCPTHQLQRQACKQAAAKTSQSCGPPVIPPSYTCDSKPSTSIAHRTPVTACVRNNSWTTAQPPTDP